MPQVTLTPVGGNPFSTGAVELDPATAPPLTVHVPDAPGAALVNQAPDPQPDASLLARLMRQGGT